VFSGIPRKRIAGFCCLLLMLSILTGSISLPCTAAVSPFEDVSPDHWALKHITKLNCRQVITGYEDGSFKPDRQVTQLEALLLAVRNLSREAAIASVDDTQKLAIEVPEWARTKYKKELLYAIQQGMIVPEENNFNANAPANRAWITQLMVRMIGKDAEAIDLSHQTPVFTDFADIPRWALGYINAGVKYSLINGFPDNTMKPLQSVTRAQAATMLSNSQPYLDLSETIKEGVVIDLSGSAVTLTINGNAAALYFNEDTSLFDSGARIMEVSGLSINDRVELIAFDSQIKYLAVLDPGSESDGTIIGTVLHIIEAQNLIVVKDSGDQVYSHTWDNNSSCIDQTGQSYAFKNIIAGTQVQLTANSRGVIITMAVYNADQVGVYDRIIYDLVTEQQLIILKDSSDHFSSYLYGSDLAVTIAGMRFPSIADLQIGDEVQITVRGSYVNKIELLKARQELTLSGKVVVVDPGKRLLVVNAQGSLQTYSVAEDVIITIPEIDQPLLADIAAEDMVELTIKDGVLTEISVIL